MAISDFSWEDFIEGKVYVHCATEARAKAFLQECHEHHIKWVTEHDAKDIVEWDRYKEDTIYDMTGNSNGRHSRLRYGNINGRAYKADPKVIMDYITFIVAPVALEGEE